MRDKGQTVIIPVKVTNGVLNVNYVSVVNNARVNAIVARAN
jgi:hypothetical protein